MHLPVHYLMISLCMHIQKNPDCLFGVILAMYLKYESSTRGGLHAHGQTCQPFLQAEQLRRMMADETVFKEHLFAFFESVMCAYFPVPTHHPTPTAQWPEPWVEASPLCKSSGVYILNGSWQS